MTTPIEKILREELVSGMPSSVKIRALDLVKRLGITTVEEFSQYHKSDLLRPRYLKGLKLRGVGKRTIDYIERCLNEASIYFMPEYNFRNAFDSVGEKNIKEYLVETIRILQKEHPAQKGFGTNEVRRKTISRIADRIDSDDGWDFMDDALPRYKVPGLLKELLKEGRISDAFPAVGSFKARPGIYRINNRCRK